MTKGELQKRLNLWREYALATNCLGRMLREQLQVRAIKPIIEELHDIGEWPIGDDCQWTSKWPTRE